MIIYIKNMWVKNAGLSFPECLDLNSSFHYYIAKFVSVATSQLWFLLKRWSLQVQLLGTFKYF